MVVGQLAFASMGFIDTVLLGSLGVEALAGGALGAMVFQFFHIVGIGVLAATANLIAFEKGREQDQGIHSSLLSGTVTVVLLSIFFGVIVYNGETLLLLFGQDPSIVSITTLYLDVIVWGLLPAFTFILLRSLALGVGDPSSVLPVSIIAAASNYPISYILMHGSFGLPALGVQGVALGTVIVSVLMVIGMTLLIYRKEEFKPFRFWKGWKNFRYSNMKETYRLGVPIAIAHAMEVGMFSAAALLIGTMGAQALAAHQIVLQCVTLSFMLPLGLSQAVSVKVGKHYGAGNVRETKQISYYGLMLSSATAISAGLVFWLFPEFLVEIFIDASVSQEEFLSVLSLASTMLLIGAMFQLVDGWQVVLMGVLRGFKLGTSPTVIAMISYWGIGFPAAYFLGQSMGPSGVWGGMGLGLGASALLLAFLLFRTFKKAF